MKSFGTLGWGQAATEVYGSLNNDISVVLFCFNKLDTQEFFCHIQLYKCY